MRISLLIVSVLAFALVLTGCSYLVDIRADLKEAEAEARYPPEGQLINVDGRMVHVVVAGSGPDLVLIHGASGSTRDFTFSLTPELTDHYRVIVFDRPGLGWSERISDAFEGAYNTRSETPIEQARFLAKAARQLGADRPLVLGHSYGAAVAMAWALEEDPAGLVILSGATMPWEGGLGPLYMIASSALGGAQIVPLLTAFVSEQRVENVVATIFEPQSAPPGYLRYFGPGLTLRRETFRANARQVSDLKRHVIAMSPRYGDVTVPVEIVHGTADEVVPAAVHAERLAPLLPNAHLTLLDGIGHTPQHVAVTDVVAAIDRAATRAGLR